MTTKQDELCESLVGVDAEDIISSMRDSATDGILYLDEAATIVRTVAANHRKTLLRYMGIVAWKTGKNFAECARELKDPLGLTESEIEEIEQTARRLGGR